VLKTIAPWLPYVVSPSNPAAGQPKPAILELRLPAGASDWPSAIMADTVETVELWPIDVVFTELADRAIAWYRHAADTKAKRTAATVDEMRQWIAQTYALADRLPLIGEPAAEAMRHAATHLTRKLDAPQSCFSYWPSLGTTADADKRVSVHLWAIDQLVRHINEAEAAYAHAGGGGGGNIPHTALWPALFARDHDATPPFADYNEAMKRVRKLETTLYAHQRDALMVGLLGDVMTHGRYGPDGQPRNGSALPFSN
jgi:hypothetical protein